MIKSLHSFGVGESIIGERIKELMQPGRNPDVGTRVNAGVVTVRLVARGRTEAEAQALLAPAREEVRLAMGEACFGEDGETLSGAALRALLERKKTVAVAESCTAGLVTAMLTETPGSSAALLEGAVVYSNEAKLRTCNVKPETILAHGAVSAQVAAELAAGIRARAGAGHRPQRHRHRRRRTAVHPPSRWAWFISASPRPKACRAPSASSPPWAAPPSANAPPCRRWTSCAARRMNNTVCS